MPVKLKCTNCEKVLSVPDAARGKAVKCPECQTRLAVPEDDDSAKSSLDSLRKGDLVTMECTTITEVISAPMLSDCSLMDNSVK